MMSHESLRGPMDTTTNSRIMRLGLGLLAAVALGGASAQATITLVAEAPPTTKPDDNGKGTIETWVAAAVDAYSAALPSPGNEVFRVNTNGESPDSPPPAYSAFPTFPNDTTSIEIPLGVFNYVVFHWGGPQKNGEVITHQVYYIGGESSGSATFDAPYSTGSKSKQYGLSYYSVFGELPVTPVPEPATYLAGALALAALVVGGRRRF